MKLLNCSIFFVVVEWNSPGFGRFRSLFFVGSVSPHAGSGIWGDCGMEFVLVVINKLIPIAKLKQRERTANREKQDSFDFLYA